MVNVVGIRFKKVGKIYYFEPQDLKINKGDYLIVETARGIELGECVIGIKEISEEEIISPLKKVLRIATEEDILKHKENKDKEVAALEICLKKIEELTGLSLQDHDSLYLLESCLRLLRLI